MGAGSRGQPPESPRTNRDGRPPRWEAASSPRSRRAKCTTEGAPSPRQRPRPPASPLDRFRRGRATLAAASLSVGVGSAWRGERRGASLRIAYRASGIMHPVSGICIMHHASSMLCGTTTYRVPYVVQNASRVAHRIMSHISHPYLRACIALRAWRGRERERERESQIADDSLGIDRIVGYRILYGIPEGVPTSRRRSRAHRKRSPLPQSLRNWRCLG